MEISNDYELITSLEKLGLTNNEAKIFIYIAQNPNSNGYEISKNTGISRSLIYSSLEKLRSIGLLELIQTNSASYKVKPFQEIKTVIQNDISNAFDILEAKMANLKNDYTEEMFITIPERENQIAKMMQMVRNAKKSLYISAGMRELEWIFKDLIQVNEKVDVHIFSLTKITGLPERFKIYSKSMEDSFIQSLKNLKNRWRILIIKDKEEMILCGGNDFSSGVGIFTKNSMMTTFATEHFIHDVKIYNIENKYKIEDNTEEMFS